MIGRERQDPRLHSYSAWMRGRIRAMRGDWEAAIADLDESLESSLDPLTSSYAMGWLGFAYRGKGDHARAIAVLEQAVASFREFRFRRLVCVFGGFLAGAYRSAGRIDEAREAAGGAFPQRGSCATRGPSRSRAGARQIDLAAGDCRGRAPLGEALEVFAGLEKAFEVAVTHLDLASRAPPGAPEGRPNTSRSAGSASRRSARPPISNAPRVRPACRGVPRGGRSRRRALAGYRPLITEVEPSEAESGPGWGHPRQPKKGLELGRVRMMPDWGSGSGLIQGLPVAGRST